MDQSLQNNGLPTNVGDNIKAPTLSDIGGSLGDKAGTLNQGTTMANNNYQSSMAGAGSVMNPFSTYQDLLKQNGIPQLQQTSESLQGNVNSLENAINRVTPNVTANTANSLVTEPQREGMVNTQTGLLNLQLDPIANALGQVNTSLATQEQNIGNEVNALGQNNQLLSNAGQFGVTVAQDNAARQMTGYTTDADNMLQGLLKKMDIQGTLDASEWDTLSKLAEQKQAYQQQLGQIAAGQKYQTLPAGGTLVNTQTGQKTVGGNPVTPTLSSGSYATGTLGSNSSGSNTTSRPPLSSFYPSSNSGITMQSLGLPLFQSSVLPSNNNTGSGLTPNQLTGGLNGFYNY